MQGVRSLLFSVKEFGIALLESIRVAVVRAAAFTGFLPLAALLALLLTLPLLGLGFSAHRLFTVRMM